MGIFQYFYALTINVVAMNNFLEEYLKQKHEDTLIEERKPGPVVTISRAFGCEGNYIARNLAEKLNVFYRGFDQEDDWEIINKEIIEESARELQTKKEKVEYIFAFEKRTSLDDFFMSLTSRQYQSEWKVREAVKNVVRAFAHRGKSIIVGRAGAQICHDLKDSLHIKLIASFAWRVNHIKEKYSLSQKEANRRVKEVDANRQKLHEMFSKTGDCEKCYDVVFNLERLSGEMIISDIIHLMQLKKLI